MALPKKFVVVPNPATRDLWRIAESGAIDELEAVLPRAEINARNEHGMTALMRAACYGRVQMVRALLEHGADPNLERNDNFTALSLAAFFGHTEIVEMLLKHGARTDVATRYGTSPQMWATARSYVDVAKCLEKRSEHKHVEQKHVEHKHVDQEPVPARSVQPVLSQRVSTPALPVEVRTLKDPPEIWDLVHEAPRNFNARSAFLARIGSMKMRFVLLAAAVLVVVGAGIGGALFWKTDKPPQAAVSLPAAPVKAAAAAPVAESPREPSGESTRESAREFSAPSADVETPITPVETSVSVPRRSRSVASSRSTKAAAPGADNVATAPAAPAPPAAAKAEPPKESVTKEKPAAPLSSQMISPPKPAQPKAKVIQWP